MQKICSSNPPVVTGICNWNNSWAWHHHRIIMCVGYFKNSISVIVKMLQVLQLSGLFVCLVGGLWRFSVPGGTEEIAGLWFARGGQYPDWHYRQHYTKPLWLLLFLEQQDCKYHCRFKICLFICLLKWKYNHSSKQSKTKTNLLVTTFYLLFNMLYNFSHPHAVNPHPHPLHQLYLHHPFKIYIFPTT